MNESEATRADLANRIFFKLYQCANMMHKTGTRALQDEGLSTQQWAVLGALSHPKAAGGMGVGELARHLMVSRQNLAGLVARMEHSGHVCVVADERDRRARRVVMTEPGRRLWVEHTVPKVHAYYRQVMDGFSITDMAHTLHYLVRLLERMDRLDQGGGGQACEALDGAADGGAAEDAAPRTDKADKTGKTRARGRAGRPGG